MSKEEWVVIVVIAFFAIIGFFTWLTTSRNRGIQRSKSTMKGLGVTLSAESSSEITPAVKIEDAISKTGSIVATDGTGRGAHGSKLNADKDITFTSNLPPNEIPKA